MRVNKFSIGVALAAALLLGALTFLWLIWDRDGTRASEEFVDSDRFRIWISLLCIQSAAWGALALVLVGLVRRLYKAFPAPRQNRGRIALMALLVTVLALGFLAAYSSVAPYYPLTHRQLKLGVITLVGLAVALVAVVGMWVAAAALQDLSQFRQGGALSAYVRLRDELRRFLGFAAAIVGVALLSTGALRGAVLASPYGEEFPPEYVLYYGAYFSALLALAYAPAYLEFRGFGFKLLDALAPFPDNRAESWAEWYEERKALERFMELDVATGKGLRSGLAIAAPFAGSAVGLLFGAGA